MLPKLETIVNQSSLSTSYQNTRVFDMAIATALESIEASVILRQLHYWLSKDGVGVIIDGTKFIYNSYKKWVREQFTFLTEWKFRKEMNKLRSLGLVEVVRHRKKEYNQTNYYTINYQALFEWASARSIEILDLWDTTDRDVESQTIEMLKTSNSYTKNTSKQNSKDQNTHKERENQKPKTIKRHSGKPKVKSNPGLNCKLISEGKNDSERIINEISNAPWESHQEFAQFRKDLIAALPTVANSYNPRGLANKIITQLKNGEGHEYWDDWKAGKLIGSCDQQEWEIKPGVVFPVFLEYLAEKLRAGNNTQTPEQAKQEAYNVVSRPMRCRGLWEQFKRSVVNAADQVKRDRALGVSNPNTPIWSRKRDEISFDDAIAAGRIIESASDMADNAIAPTDLSSVKAILSSRGVRGFNQ